MFLQYIVMLFVEECDACPKTVQSRHGITQNSKVDKYICKIVYNCIIISVHKLIKWIYIV